MARPKLNAAQRVELEGLLGRRFDTEESQLRGFEDLSPDEMAELLRIRERDYFLLADYLHFRLAPGISRSWILPFVAWVLEKGKDVNDWKRIKAFLEEREVPDAQPPE